MFHFAAENANAGMIDIKNIRSMLLFGQEDI